MEKPKRKPVPDPDLAFALEFTAEDLAANREGVITEEQFPILEERLVRSILAVALTILLTGGFLILWGKMGENLRGNRFNQSSYLIVLALIIIFAVAIFIQHLKTFVMVRADIRKEQVDSKSGRIILEGIKLPLGTAYRIKYGDTRFVVDGRTYSRFKHLDYYTVYYTPYSKTILSAEPEKSDIQ